MRGWQKRGLAGIGAAVLAFGPAFGAGAASAAGTAGDVGSAGWESSSSLYEIRTWAGQNKWGSMNGAAKDATLFSPHSIAALPDGRLLVADAGNHLLRVLTADQAATYGGVSIGEDEGGLPLGALYDDTLAKAVFNEPSGLAVDAAGNVYVADTGNNAIRRITPDGAVTTLAGDGLIGADDGKGADARFYAPSDVAVDAKGNVYVADTLNNVIRKIAADGTVSTLTAPSTRVTEYVPGAVAPSGDYADGPVATAKFNEPSGLALDPKGNLYVSDRGNQRIRYIDFAAGTVTTVAGSAPAYAEDSLYAEGDYADGAALTARFNAPEGLAVTADGAIVVADSLNHAIRLLKDGKVTTLAGEATEYGSADGIPHAAQFNHPTDVAVLADGRLAIADEGGNRIRVLAPYAKPAGLKADGTIRTLLDGVLVKTDVEAYQTNGATLLPLRAVGEALGYQVGYDAKTGSGTLSKDGIEYTIKVGEKKATRTTGGTATELTLNAAPAYKQGRLFVPVRFFAAEAGLDIQWDAAAAIVVMRHPIFAE